MFPIIVIIQFEPMNYFWSNWNSLDPERHADPFAWTVIYNVIHRISKRPDHVHTHTRSHVRLTVPALETDAFVSTIFGDFTLDHVKNHAPQPATSSILPQLSV